MMKYILFIVCTVPSLVYSLNSFICDHNTATLSCNAGYSIQIRSVNYGRTSTLVCNRNPTINCYSSGRTTGYIANACNGKNICRLTAEASIIGEDPCPNVPKYLDLQYDCDPIPTTSTTTTTTTTMPTTQPQPTSKTGPQVCHEYLISGPHGIPDNKLTASTTFNNNSNSDYSPSRGRLFLQSVRNTTYMMGGWSAAVNNPSQYIQAELNSMSVLRGVVTQGRNINQQDHCCFERVTKYKIFTSVDGQLFEAVKDSAGNEQIFIGNYKDQETPITNMLPCPVIAKYVRIQPLDWVAHISMRFDAIGCPATTQPLGQCPSGWIERQGSNECYLLTTRQSKTWHDARRDCQLQQGDLVVIDTIQEKNWLIQELQNVQTTVFGGNLYQVYIGLNNEPRRDSLNFKWVNGKPLDNSIVPWLQGMPDNYQQSEHCGEFVNGNLNDINCNSPNNYVCEKKKYWQPPTNQFSPIKVTPITPPTTASNAVVIPTTKPYKIPGIPGGGSGGIQIGPNYFATGCVKATECRFKGQGDYQACTGCHYYLTCAPSGEFVRPCPANLVFDDNLKACSMRSSTCQGP